MDTHPGGGPGSPPPQTQAVPAFIMKLWLLLEETQNDQLISWSWNGQAFRILDEQRFAKEILPKYFKHNNLSSFIRQLNMYGFRKVISLDNGLLRTDKNSAIEFQHPLFKQGQAELLEHIKRKVSIVRAEDGKLCQEDLNKVLVEVQEMRDEQNNMDAKLDLMRRENKSLWKEVSSLRRKHDQQQELLSKILQFILSLMRRNYVVGVKRKRPLLDASGSTPPKYSRQYRHIPVENSGTLELSEHSGTQKDDGVFIQEVMDSAHSPIQILHSPAKVAEAASLHEQVLSSPGHSPSSKSASEPSSTEHAPTVYLSEINGNAVDAGVLEGDILELPSMMANDVEDPDSVLNSILNDNNSEPHTDLILDREEMQDFLNCIDVSLEELQVLLSKTKYSLDPELANNGSTENNAKVQAGEHEDAPNKVVGGGTTAAPVGACDSQPLGVCNAHYSKDWNGARAMNVSAMFNPSDKQLMQYMGNPVLSLFDDLLTNESGTATKDSEDLLAIAQDIPSQSTELNSNATLQPAPPSLDEQVNLLETCELPLLVEDINGEFKETPIFVLSPVNALIEEAKEAEID